MEFSPHDLRTLRYRMNWTQAEMAQVLGCTIDALSGRERGAQGCAFTPQQHSQLLIFLAQADSNSAQIQRRAIADELMAARGLSQIVDTEVIECLTTGELSSLSFR